MKKFVSLKTTQASLNQTALDWTQNMANIYAAIDEAVANGSDVVFMPELCITGYEVNDDFQRTDNDRIYLALTNIALYANAKDPNLIVSVGHPWRLQLRSAFESAAANPDIVKNPLYDRLNLPFNVQTLISGGNVLGMTAKANLFRDERGYENRYFNEWSFGDADQIAALLGVESQFGTLPIRLPDDREIPFGRPIFYITDEKGNSYVHVQAICEEKWVASQYDGEPGDDSRYEQLNIIPAIYRYLESEDGVLLEIANASPPSRLKQDKHTHLNNLASHYANVVVDTDGLGTSGASYSQYGHRLISQNGEVISAGQRIQFSQLATTSAIVQLHQPEETMAEKAHVQLVRHFQDPAAKPIANLTWRQANSDGAWDHPENEDRWKEELIRNLALWKFDYMRKTGSSGIAQALSGGKDSAFNCVLTRVMVELAIHDLGIDGFSEQMSHLPYIQDIQNAYRENGKDAAVKVCMDNMLTAAYMGTNNSSERTWYAAKTLIEGDPEKGIEGIGGKFLERNVQDLVTICAFIFGTKNSTQIPADRKMKIIQELESFVHADPNEYSRQDMKDWGDRLREDYPELDALTTGALPEHDIAYQNFQARVRTVLIWAIANVEKKMPEANPNLDEAYGAYATSAGDLHGGAINTNAGIHKEDESLLMEYLEKNGLQGVMDRVLALGPVNQNKPSAELRKAEQFDEDELQGTFPQKAAFSRLRHHTKILTQNGERWMNASELYDRARDDIAFQGISENKLFNFVTYFYQRWEGPAQHKIHFSPIAPSQGESVDKQTSLRTPNLSGGSRDEIVQLGIDLLFIWADQDELGWDLDTYDLCQARAWQDKKFVEDFYHYMWNRDPEINMSYNLRGLYDALKDRSWDEIFGILPTSHPIIMTENLRRLEAV